MRSDPGLPIDPMSSTNTFAQRTGRLQRCVKDKRPIIDNILHELNFIKVGFVPLQVSTIGYGDITPSTLSNPELIFTMIIECASVYHDAHTDCGYIPFADTR